MKGLRIIAYLMLMVPFTFYYVACDDEGGGGGGGDADVEEDVVEDTVPDTVEDPDVTEDPDAVEDPDLVADPDVTADPDVAQDPDVAEDPDAVEDPDVADVSDATDMEEEDMVTPVGPVVIISEIVDGQYDLGQPKWVELTNVGDETADLSEYSVGVFTNGHTYLNPISYLGGPSSTIAVQLSGTLQACDSYVLLFADPGAETSIFSTVYATTASNTEFADIFNGDDVIALFMGTITTADDLGTGALLVDVFGTIGVDGSGEDWEYQDSYAYRLEDVLAPFVGGADCPMSTMVTSWAGCGQDLFQWTFGVNDALDTTSTAVFTTLTSPFEHVVDSCP